MKRSHRAGQAWEEKLRKLGRIGLAVCLLLAVLSPKARAHDDEDKPKKPTKAQKDLKRAREAMDSYKTALTKAGKYSCCVQKPMGSKVGGCDLCAKTAGSCNCGANLASGKGVCGECYGAWKGGKGSPAFGKVDTKTLKILSSDHQKRAGLKKPSGEGASAAIEVTPERKAYGEALIAAKRTMIGEQRYVCCVGNGGCDECAYEGYCPCGKNLAKDLDAKPGDKKRGICAQCLDGQHGGHGRVGGGIKPEEIALAPRDDGEHMGSMGHLMGGTLGPYAMNQEGSGTTWLPQSSPMYGKMSQSGRWRLMQMGNVYGVLSDPGGPRGQGELFAPTQFMLMAQRNFGESTLGIRTMFSLDPLLIGKRGYPDLFQTGETAFGRPLQDRQHPHDLIMELGATYSKPITKDLRGFLYLAPAGEPAIGPTAYPHRPSAWDNPTAPISHHWLDGTHITYGVGTLGVTLKDRWKLEGSMFTGREPDEERYDIDPFRFDSFAGRLTFNPSKNWSLQTSYASLHNLERQDPGNQHRFTVSAAYNRPLDKGNLALTALYGQNTKNGKSTTDAFVLEGAYTLGRNSFFARWENVAKDELVNLTTPGNNRINKWTLGASYNFQQSKNSEQGIGASVDFYHYPDTLKPDYGASSPVGFTVFYRLRFGKM